MNDYEKLHGIISDLQERLTTVEEHLDRILNKTGKSYKSVESRMTYKEDKRRLLKKYNEKHQTQYEYVPEAIAKIYKTGVSCVEIGEIFDVTSAAITQTLKKLGIKIRDCRRTTALNLSKEAIAEIRASSAKQIVIANRHKISSPTVRSIQKKLGRWAYL